MAKGGVRISQLAHSTDISAGSKTARALSIVKDAIAEIPSSEVLFDYTPQGVGALQAKNEYFAAQGTPADVIRQIERWQNGQKGGAATPSQKDTNAGRLGYAAMQRLLPNRGED